jgi:C_GCAxxG_C_C family probable redox protein
LSKIAWVEQRFAEKLKELNRELPGKYRAGKIDSQNCAALTMRGFLEILNTVDQNLINMAAPLAGITNICGAVNAGLMIIGLIIGEQGGKGIHQVTASTEGVRFLKHFKKRFGTILCSELTGCNLMTLEGMQNYMQDNIWEKKCYKNVIVALELIGSLYKNQIAKLIKEKNGV